MGEADQNDGVAGDAVSAGQLYRSLCYKDREKVRREAKRVFLGRRAVRVAGAVIGGVAYLAFAVGTLAGMHVLAAVAFCVWVVLLIAYWVGLRRERMRLVRSQGDAKSLELFLAGIELPDWRDDSYEDIKHLPMMLRAEIVEKATKKAMREPVMRWFTLASFALPTFLLGVIAMALFGPHPSHELRSWMLTLLFVMMPTTFHHAWLRKQRVRRQIRRMLVAGEV